MSITTSFKASLNINNWHRALEFTYEKEDLKGELNFLDFTIIRNQQNMIETKWFRKPTNNGITLDYTATAPTKYKRSVVRSFVYRIFAASSKWIHFHQGIEIAKDILKDNSYPDNFVNPIIHDTLEKLIRAERKNHNDFQEQVKMKKLFFIQFRGPETTQFMNKLIDNHVPIFPIYTTKKLKNMLPSLKSKMDKGLRSNVIYDIKCPNCWASYIGMTERHLCKRITEHFHAGGTLSKHIDECGVVFNGLEHTSIIDTTNKGIIHLSILEALHIKEKSPILNTRDEYKSRKLRLRF